MSRNDNVEILGTVTYTVKKYDGEKVDGDGKKPIEVITQTEDLTKDNYRGPENAIS